MSAEKHPKGKVMKCEACEKRFFFSGDVGDVQDCPSCGVTLYRSSLDPEVAIRDVFSQKEDGPIEAEVIRSDFERKHMPPQEKVPENSGLEGDREELIDNDSEDVPECDATEEKSEEEVNCSEETEESDREESDREESAGVDEKREGDGVEAPSLPSIQRNASTELSNPYKKIVIPKLTGSLVENDIWTNYRKETIMTKVKDQFEFPDNRAQKIKSEDVFILQIRHLISRYAFLAICVLITVGVVCWSFFS